MLVCILRLEDICEDCEEEKDRRTCWQGRSEDVAGDEANLRTKLDDDAKGAKTLCADMVECRGMQIWVVEPNL